MLNKTPLDRRWHTRCSFGSFVEVIQGNTITVGVVTQPQRKLFKEKTMSMITAHGDTMQFEPSQVNFHLASLIQDDVVNAEDVPRLISSFVKCSWDAKLHYAHLIPVIQAWYTKESRSVELDLMAVYKSIMGHSKMTDTLPECVLYGLHMHLSTDPLNFRLETNEQREVLQTMTSDSVPVTHYTANSMELTEDLREVMSFEYDILNGFNSCLQDIQNGIPQPNLLTRYMESQEKKDILFMDVNMLITFLIYFKSYPHPGLNDVITRVLGSLFLHDSYGVSQALDLMKITSPILPAEPIGFVEPMDTRDHFKHVRVTNTSKVYLLPSTKLDQRGFEKLTEIGISLQKNHDFWVFNIHIPDVGAEISQSPKHLNSLLSRVVDLDVSSVVESLLPHDTLKRLAFHDGKECHSLTISITYPQSTDRPWYKTTTSIKLERLVNVQYVPLKDLNELWRSRFPILSDLLNMFMSNDYDTLNSDDRTLLLNMINMIDYWCLKRGAECSMDQQFPKKDSNDDDSFLGYITSELRTIASHHALQYAQRESIPLLIQSQPLLSPLDDSFHVESSNLVIPSYDAHNYQELTFSKDPSGLTPISNYIAAISYLSPVNVGTSKSPFVSLGLKEGFVNVVDGLSDLESIANQWQLICDLQRKFVLSQSDYKMGVTTLFMRNFKMKSSDELQKFYELSIAPLKRANLNLERRTHQHAVLEALRSGEDSWVFFKCIAVRSATYPQSLRAYCFELGIEVEVQLSPQFKEVLCGDQLICNRVISLTTNGLVLQV